ncbi:unnamed protein product [Toxocara canis]|nr:unnamed protein product [Toxocara canis]
MHPAIAIHYEFAALVIEVRQLHTSVFQLLVRLCSVVGGMFATSTILNALFRRALCLSGFEVCSSRITNNTVQTIPAMNLASESKYKIVET